MSELSALDTDVAGVPLNIYSPALASSLVIPGHVCVYGFTASSTRGSSQYVMWFDNRALPADGAVPINFIDISSNTAKGVSWLDYGREFLNGFALCNSTTNTSKTIGSADTWFDVQYVVLA